MVRHGTRAQNVMTRLAPLYLLPLKVLERFSGITGVAHFIEYLPYPVPALRRFGATVGYDTVVYPRITIHGALDDFSNLRIGDSVRIVRNCTLDLTDRITVEDKAIVSFGCTLITHRNVYRSPTARLYPLDHAPITIEYGAVLFANVTVLAGVTIGECAVVAAGAVVTEDVPSWTLVGGVPARVLRSLR